MSGMKSDNFVKNMMNLDNKETENIYSSDSSLLSELYQRRQQFPEDELYLGFDDPDFVPVSKKRSYRGSTDALVIIRNETRNFDFSKLAFVSSYEGLNLIGTLF